MRPQVEKWIPQANAAKEKAKQELAINLSLFEPGQETQRVYSEHSVVDGKVLSWDAVKQKYYYEIQGTPLQLTDEEYEVLKPLETKKQVTLSIPLGAKTFAIIACVLNIIGALICFVKAAEMADSRYYDDTIMGLLLGLGILWTFSGIAIALLGGAIKQVVEEIKQSSESKR